MNDLTNTLLSIAGGVMIGFLGVGVLAEGMDKLEASRCPEVTRVRANGGTILKDWASYGRCPDSGLVAPLKP